MSNVTDKLVHLLNVPLHEFSVTVPINGSVLNLNLNTSTSSPSFSSLDEDEKAPPPDNNVPPPPSASPSHPPPVEFVGASKTKGETPKKSPPAPSPDDPPQAPPPPPPVVPPPPPSPSPSPSLPSSSTPPPSSNNPPPSQGPPPPSSTPPPPEVPPPPSPSLFTNASILSASNESPLPLKISPALPPPPPPAVSLPPPDLAGVTPVTGTPALAPPVPGATPAVPGIGYPPPPPLTETSPSTFPTPPLPMTNEEPIYPGPPSGTTTGDSTSLTKPNSDSSSTSTSKDPSDSAGLARGAAVGITLAGVAVIIVAIFFLVSRKKKRRSECLAVHYAPTHGYPPKPDGYYYGQATPIGNTSQYTCSYASQPPSLPSANGTYGSFHDHVSYSGSPKIKGLGNSKSFFTYEEITEMTNGFSRQNLLGEGGFGCVYKGWLTDGRAVAVKQLKDGSGQGEREFRAEVEIISRVHHRHLVSLVGYCIADNHRSLVYEFLPNKTLEYHLHGKGLPVMEWSKRLRIAVGAARGLAYLHDDCHPKIIHRDIKTANILLDETFEAQVADFGLARLTNDTNTHVSTRVVGTFGYMAPEYASSGKLTDKSDVFSFGVVLLELITGRKPVDTSQPLGEESLVEWARPLLVDALESGNLDGLVDPRLDGSYSKSEMFRMMEAATSCVRHSAAKRPRMVQVLRALDSAGELSDLSNGLKFGQSTVFDSRQYSADIQQFRRMAFGSDSDISDRSYTEEFDSDSMMQSREYNSGEALRPLNSGRQNSGKYQSSHEFSSTSLGRRPTQSYGSRRYSGRSQR